MKLFARLTLFFGDRMLTATRKPPRECMLGPAHGSAKAVMDSATAYLRQAKIGTTIASRNQISCMVFA